MEAATSDTSHSSRRSALQCRRHQVGGPVVVVVFGMLVSKAFVGVSRPSSFGAQTQRASSARKAAGDEDPWAVLGLPRGSSTAEIKRTYRRRALKEHPDVNKAPDAKQKWLRLSRAYDILSDPEKMRQWEASRTQSASRAYRGQSSSGRGRQEPSSPPGSTSEGAPDLSAVGSVLRGAAQAVVGAAGIAGKAVGYAGKAAEVAVPVVKSALEDISPRAARLSKMKLQELLEALGATGSKEASASTVSADLRQELRLAEKESERLQADVAAKRAEEELCERRAKECQKIGDRQGELEALRGALSAREARRHAKDALLRCYDRIDYLRKTAQEFT
eukprot:TRINITY_DN98436_c0_g1_i1.p1 TRINITY_DN98436_c0_g1~~TRINITY_DN98436_c0_g1_i1.p1  ORF type:complete len:343 (+),score=73.52 TRINITY_DN98436_c0_g1_i1:33-1031(+)